MSYNEDERKRWGSNYENNPEQVPQNMPVPLAPQQGLTYGPPPTQSYPTQGNQYSSQQYPQGNPLQGGWNTPPVRTATMGKISMWLAVASVVPSLLAMITSLVLIDTGSYTSAYNYDTPFLLIALIGIVSIASPMVGLTGVVIAIIALAKNAGKKYALIAFGIFGIGAVFTVIGFVIALLGVSA